MKILKIRDELLLNSDDKHKYKLLLTFWLPVFIIFFIGNTSIDRYTHLTKETLVNYNHVLPNHIQAKLNERGLDWFVERIENDLIVPTRASLYFFSLIILSLPILKTVKNFIVENLDRKILIQSFIIFALLFLLAASINLSSIAPLSLKPFSQPVGWYYRRIFVTSLSYFTHLNGYLLFPIFSSCVLFLLLSVILVWFKNNNIDLNTFHYISLFSSGLTIHIFHYLGGRTSHFILLMALISLLVPLSKYGRATLVVLMFSTHEAAALSISVPLILFLYPKNERKMHLPIIFLYFSLWLLNFGFDIGKAINAQTILGEKSSFELLAESPGRAAIGVFFAYKFLWLFLFFAGYYAIKKGDINYLLKCLFIIFLPFFQLPLAADTSRLIAFGYLGILALVVYCHKQMNRIIFNALLFLNLLLPSIDVGLWGFNWPGGLYKINKLLFESIVNQ